MAESGRIVTLAKLAGWRKEGLLPPLASHGLGMRKGKSYYWKEPEIVAHASATYDLLHKYGRPEVVLWMLWLSGFSIPMPQFRRVWAHRGRNHKIWTSRPAAKWESRPGSLYRLERPAIQGQGGATHLLLQASLALGGTLVPDDGDGASITRVIERALAWITQTSGISTAEDDRAAERLWLVVRIVCSALENSDLISVTSDGDLREAQKYLLLAGTLLQKCNDRPIEEIEEAAWPTWLAERMAAPVFLLILVLLRSGHKPMLDEIAQRLGKVSRRDFHPPAQPAYSAV